MTALLPRARGARRRQAFVISLVAIGSCSAVVPPQPTREPPPSAGHAVVFHEGLGAFVLVNTGLGGMTSPSADSRTVLWVRRGDSWIVLDSVGPPVRNLGGVAYDAARRELVMFGGSYSTELVYDDTWTWAPDAGWRQRAGAGPGRRDHTQMAYDRLRERVVLYGGQASLTDFPVDTWLWDGERWERAPAVGPGPRLHHTLVSDPESGNLILFGGIVPGAGASGEAWVWDGAAWTRLESTRPPRSHATLAVTSRGLALIGGFPAAGSGSLPLFAAGTWRIDPQPGAPVGRYLSAAAYDPHGQRTILFGGGDPAGDRLLADTWEFHASSGWTRVR